MNRFILLKYTTGPVGFEDSEIRVLTIQIMTHVQTFIRYGMAAALGLVFILASYFAEFSAVLTRSSLFQPKMVMIFSELIH